MKQKALLKFKEIEYLLKKQLPDVKFKDWNEHGAIVSLDFLKLKSQKGKWEKATIYTFEKISLPKKVDFAVRYQKVKDKDDYQLIIQ